MSTRTICIYIYEIYSIQGLYRDYDQIWVVEVSLGSSLRSLLHKLLPQAPESLEQFCGDCPRVVASSSSLANNNISNDYDS